MIAPLLLDLSFGAALGAILGSAGGALVTRWPAGRPMRRGRSACDGCGRVLGAAELVPLLSWLARRGRCRSCGAAIDQAQPLAEALTLAVGATAFAALRPLGPLAVGDALPLMAALIVTGLGWCLAVLALLDWRHFWLPDRLTLPLLAGGLAVGGLALAPPLGDRLLGVLALGGTGWLAARSYAARTGRTGLGRGDVKLMAALGAWTGWAGAPLVLLLAALGGLAQAALTRRRSAATRYPFGTHLALAAGLLGAARLAGIPLPA